VRTVHTSQNCSDSILAGDLNLGSALVFFEHGFAGDHTFQTFRIGAIDYRNKRIVVYVAKRGIERKIRSTPILQTGSRTDQAFLTR
jgi:hypothetical protein